MTVRPEKAGDEADVRRVVSAAFGSPTEADLFMALDEASPELLELRRLEGTYGLPSDRRIIMRRTLGTGDRR